MNLLVDVVNVFVDDDGAFGNPLGIVWSSPSTRKHEQQIAADLGFSATTFIDAVADRVATARIFTPTRELPFAGHPTVGLAAWLRSNDDDVDAIKVPAGRVRVRIDGDMVFVTGLPEWTPKFELNQLTSPEEVYAVDPDAYGYGLHYVWAWFDENGRARSRTHLRTRVRDPRRRSHGLGRDAAHGRARARSGHRAGTGSLLHTHVRYLGQQVEVGGLVSEAEMTELR